MGAPSFARTRAIVAAMLLAAPGVAAAGQTKLTFTLRPGASGSPVAMEVASSGSRPAIPSLTLSGGGSKAELTGWSLPLPAFAIRGVKLAPRYGNQQFSLGFQPSALPGMSVDPRHMRGFALTATGRAFSGTVVAGRAGRSRSTNLLEPAVPHLVGFSGTVTPRRNLVFSPRLVAPVRKETGVDAALGLGVRASVAPHLTAIADVGTTRTRTKEWAPLGTAALSGIWRLTEFEAGSSYAARGTTLVGAVPFAATTRHFSTVRVRLARGVTTEGRIARVASLTGTDRTLTRSGSLSFDRLIGGSLRLQFDHGRTTTQLARDTSIEWRAHGIGIHFRQESERTRRSVDVSRTLQLELPAIRGSHGIQMGLSSTMRLSGRTGDPRAAMRIASRISPGRLVLSSEAEVDALKKGSVVRLGRLLSRAEIPVAKGTSIQIGHTYAPGDRAALWRRVELRFMRAFAL